ncbi:hypothetical protein H8F21_14440 [Pseudomonas sp. P66]|uniref:Uncharacterized protein n=1 Tax=Pseudomonas arcuscaelestis TaxID=2710591 RepID=A0ABS2BYS1_9PSED|nr:hypothetical protein [Pseudomonas arcuscaelestis]MBM5458763.1 hypothetical protein [Pseudomonas arcuscaelestis]
MDTILTSALTNRVAMRYARRVCNDREAGMPLELALTSRAVPEGLWEDMRAITAAVDAGWFAVPAGPGLTYSKTQHGALTLLSSRAPWLNALHAEATAFESMRQATGIPLVKGFGVISLPDFQADAVAAGTRLARLPREHAAGEITLELWVQVLLDTQAIAQHIRTQMECLSPAWMWDPLHPLPVQIERLRDHGCLHLLLAYVSNTRDRYLDTFERKLLGDVQYRGLAPAEYERRWAAELQRRADVDRSHWQETYALIRRLAGIMDGVASYHQATLTRRLKQESNGAFRLQRSELTRDGLVVEVRPNFCVGQNQKLETGFMLVNYCQALADETESAALSFPAYLDACDRASSRIRDLEEPSSAPAPRRPRDDFDTAAA